MFGRAKKSEKAPPSPPPSGTPKAASAAQTGPATQPKNGGSGSHGLVSLLEKGLTLQPDRIAMLKQGLDKGLEFFEKFNESRLKLAFSSFDEDMKVALYEVLYLLHVNDPKLKEYTFTATRVEHIGGRTKTIPYETTICLYLEGAPHGVEGIDQLSPIFKENFEAHIQKEFGAKVSPVSTYGFNPITSIGSLGSIGTVGHKSLASDLDLQVQYELEPFLFDSSSWTDDTLKDGLGEEVKFWINRQRVAQKLSPEAMKDPKILQGLRGKAVQQVAKIYPHLYKYLMTQGGGNIDLHGDAAAQKRQAILHEIIALMKRVVRLKRGEELKKFENLFKEKANQVQDYIVKKYPLAEIYLFTASNDGYRRGHHGTTLESKESSGSAYELILNYETLMPGIQMTPMVPGHFIVPDMINNDTAMYDRILDYIRFKMVDIYKDVGPRIANLGATPDMPQTYVAKHSGAVYWEAFKASSGNIPKALLNLFRYEMLLDRRFVKTNIQIIKKPDYLNQFVAPKPADESEQLVAMVEGRSGIPPWAILELEEMFPLLLQDPWWQRYKALKVGFHEPKGIEGIEDSTRLQISMVIDLCFALHVRISDVFTKPGDTRTFDSHREQVLLQFLKRAFPPVSGLRKFLEHLFAGEIQTVNQFEILLRNLFKTALDRVNKKIASFNIAGESNQKEFEIWYHYYQQNFEPAANVVPKTIMSHLTVARERVQIGFKLKEGWFFKSLQKQSNVGKRFDTFGTLDVLPEEVMLRERVRFLVGLADIVMNGYYGVTDEGKLKETRTVLEFDAKSMDLGNRTDNNLAFVRPDILHRLINQIYQFFPYQPYHYMDCVTKPRKVTDVLVLLNLTKYGRLSFLYRDNLRTWYVDEFEHKDVFNKAQTLRLSVVQLVAMKPLHVTIAKFLKGRGVNLNEINLACWVNPNSVETQHSVQQMPLKERELAAVFRKIIYQVHAKSAPPETEGAVPSTEDVVVES